MIILLLTLCASRPKIDFYEFNVTNYTTFRDNLQKNHFLITLSTNSRDRYDFYKSFFIDICRDIARYFGKEINVSYILLFDKDLKVNYDAVFYVYLPGMSEKEVSIYPRFSVAFNSHRIISECLQQSVALRRLEKAQKSPEVARIKEELRQIAKLLRTKDFDDDTRTKYLNDYNSLTNELMQYIPENKQKERKLRLQLQIVPKESRKYKKLEKEIKKEKELREKYSNKKNKSEDELSPEKIEKIKEKKIIMKLRIADDNSSLMVIVSVFVAMYKWLKKIVIKIFNMLRNHHAHRDDL